MNTDNYATLMSFCAQSMFGACRVVSDREGVPDVHVRIDREQINTLISPATGMSTHPAFVVDSAERSSVYVGKFNGTAYRGKLYSYPLEKPAFGMTWDEARIACEEKGAGHHMMTLPEWAMLCLLCRREDRLPKGNNANGHDASEAKITGVPVQEGDKVLLLEGTGNSTYSHTGDNGGVFGLNGNVRNWIAGYRLVDGEIQIIPDNNAAMHAEMGEKSTLWKAVMPDGTLVTPGTNGTLHWNWLNGKLTLDTMTSDTQDTVRETVFEDLATSERISSVPAIIRALALYPDGKKWDKNTAVCRMNLTGERMPFVGGCSTTGTTGGLFAMSCIATREDAYDDVGARPAYCEIA